MLMRWTAGILYAVTALVTGYLGLRVMFTPSGGGRFFWWPLIMFGAPILLLVGGILTLFPQVKKRWLVALAGTILFVVWVAFVRDFSWTYWIFAVAVTLVTWGILALTSALKRNWVGGFMASLILAASWIPVSVEVLVEYFSPKPPNPDPAALLWVLAPSILAFASLIAGVASSKSSGAIKGDRLGQPAEHA